MVNLLKKYSTFIKYIFSAGTSFILDQGLFRLFLVFLKKMIGDASIFVATVLARIISSFYNYLVNRNAVFKTDKKGMDSTTFVKYFALVVIQMGVSSSLVFIGYKILEIDETLIKIPVDVFLFMINYFIQKKFIFNEN